MGRHDHRGSPLWQGGDQVFDGCGAFPVDVGQGLVEQQQFRLQGQGPGQGNALGFAAGEFLGFTFFESFKPDQGEGFGHGLFLQCPVDTAQFQAKGKVSEDAAGKQVRRLVEQGDLLAQPGQGLIGPGHHFAGEGHPPAIRLAEQAQDVKQGGLARAVGAGQQVETAAAKAQLVQVQRQLVAVALLDRLQVQ